MGLAAEPILDRKLLWPGVGIDLIEVCGGRGVTGFERLRPECAEKGTDPIRIHGIGAHVEKTRVLGAADLSALDLMEYVAVLSQFTVATFCLVEDIRSHNGVDHGMDDRIGGQVGGKAAQPCETCVECVSAQP
jgi:hypothetical protein